MEHIPQSQATRFENGAATSYEYEMPEANLNVAPIAIHGRYPESGFTSNTLSDSIVHIMDGEGVIVTSDGAVIELTSNDQLHIAIGDEYYFEGVLNIIYAATPAWTPEQARHIN